MKSIFSILSEKYHERINDLTETISDGSCRTMEEYREMSGHIKGLREALMEVRSLQERSEQE